MRILTALNPLQAPDVRLVLLSFGVVSFLACIVLGVEWEHKNFGREFGASVTTSKPLSTSIVEATSGCMNVIIVRYRSGMDAACTGSTDAIVVRTWKFAGAAATNPC